jgi:2-methylcitrate dehydratase
LTLCAEPKFKMLQNFAKFHLLEVAFKPYPCARQLHAGVEALLRLINQHSITADAIRAIDLTVPTQNASMVDRPATPTLRAATLGSGQYVMAVTALRGKIDLASFEDEYLQSESIRRLMEKVTVRASTELDRHFPKFWPGRVTVTLADGQEHSGEIIAPKGEIENPMTRQDVEEKFLGLVAPVLGDEKARAVIGEVQALDARDSLAPLLGALT